MWNEFEWHRVRFRGNGSAGKPLFVIANKRLHIDASFYIFPYILSVTPFGKMLLQMVFPDSYSSTGSNII